MNRKARTLMVRILTIIIASLIIIVSLKTIFAGTISVTLNYPANYTYNQSLTIDFNCSANTTATSLQNITLYIWNSTGDLVYSNTKLVSGTENSSKWTVTLPRSDYYEWNCLVYDSDGSSSWATYNFTADFGNLTRCRNLSNTGYTTFYLAKNITAYGLSGNCFVFDDDVNFYCNNYWILGNGTGTVFYKESSPFINIFLYYCNIKNFSKLSFGWVGSLNISNSKIVSARLYSDYHMTVNDTYINNSIIDAGEGKTKIINSNITYSQIYVDGDGSDITINNSHINNSKSDIISIYSPTTFHIINIHDSVLEGNIINMHTNYHVRISMNIENVIHYNGHLIQNILSASSSSPIIITVKNITSESKSYNYISFISQEFTVDNMNVYIYNSTIKCNNFFYLPTNMHAGDYFHKQAYLDVRNSIINCTNSLYVNLSDPTDGGHNNITAKFYNVTYGSNTDENITGENVSLYRYWWLDVQVNNTDDVGIANANVTAYDKFNTLAFSTTTNSIGKARGPALDYLHNETGYTYYSNYTVNASKQRYSDNSTTVNISLTKNTLVYFVLGDVGKPFVKIIKPENYETFSTNTSLPLNYTAYDNETSLHTCWFNVVNSTGGIDVTNTTIPNCQNTTFNVTDDDVYTLTLWVNDTDGNINSSSVEFVVSTVAPAINLNYPDDGAWLNNGTNVYFNFTATDGNGLDTCELWANFSGTWHKNYTWISPTSGVMNYTTVNLSDGYYLWNVWCNDTVGNGAFAYKNRTVGIDTTYPIVKINAPVSGYTYKSTTPTFSLRTTITEDNIDYCMYSVLDSDENVEIGNTTYDCISKDIGVSDFGTYTVIVYAVDKAGNINSSNSTFNIQQAPSSGGGGGGAVPAMISVIAFKRDSILAELSDLKRAIAYARVYEMCKNNTRRGICILSYDDRIKLQRILSTSGIYLDENETITLIEFFNKRNIEPVTVTKEDAEKYRLTAAVTEIVTEKFALRFSMADTFFFYTPALKPGEGKYFFFENFANKNIKEVRKISGSDRWNATWEGSVLRISYFENETAFINKMEEAVFSVEAESGEVVQFRIRVNVYNLGYRIFSIIPWYLLVVVIIVAPIVLWITKKNKKAKWLKNI